MAGLPDFRAQQINLQQRLRRQLPRSLYRRRLERELRGLVVEELQQELAPAAYVEQIQNIEQPVQHWFQKWEQEQEQESR